MNRFERAVSSDIENRATSGPVRAGGLPSVSRRCLWLLMGPALFDGMGFRR
jgi:hypothetical protein